MSRTTERSLGREPDAIGVETRLLEADRRVSEAERAAAALRRRAEAAEVRVAEARERVAQERSGHEETLAELTAMEERLSAELEAREADVRLLGVHLSEARGAGDATAKLQADIAVLQHRLEQGREELRAERIGRGTERSAWQQELNAIIGSLSSLLDDDVESMIGALRRKLDGEIARTRAVEQRHASLTTENQVLAEARAGVEQALLESEARAAALDAELTQRRDLMERVGTATAELRGDLIETRRALLEETRRRESTELAAREVIAAAQNVLLARTDEEGSAEEADAVIVRYARDEPREDTADRSAPPAAHRLSDVLPGPASAVTRRPSTPAISAAAPVASEPAEEEGTDGLSLRFDRIRAQLAERGVRSAKASGERKPGGPR